MTDQLPTAKLMRRLAAMIYDGFLLFALTLAYATFLLGIKVIFNGTDNLEDIQPGPILQWLSFVGWIGTLGGYYYICWRKQGQTLGMKAWRLRLQQSDGALASPEQCIKRCLSATLSLAAVGIGYLWLLMPNAKGCLHDQYTGTEVVVLAKEKK
jgi:uncharacterized RDD family membrane protein YckC